MLNIAGKYLQLFDQTVCLLLHCPGHASHCFLFDVLLLIFPKQLAEIFLARNQIADEHFCCTSDEGRQKIQLPLTSDLWCSLADDSLYHYASHFLKTRSHCHFALSKEKPNPALSLDHWTFSLERAQKQLIDPGLSHYTINRLDQNSKDPKVTCK